MQKWTIKNGETLNIQGEDGVISVVSVANVTQPMTKPTVKYYLKVDGILRQEGILNIDTTLDLEKFISNTSEVISITLINVENASETITVLALD